MSDDMLDIEVGRYALRTFQLSEGRRFLKSLFQPTVWTDGTMIAECRRVVDTKYGPEKVCTKVPGEGCHCGVYGTLSLQHLVKQYRSHARNSVAVIAAEGETLIGDQGLRASAARIVAYWTADSPWTEVYGNNCPNAKRFDDITEMLKAYKFPEYEEEWPPEFIETAHSHLPPMQPPKKMDPAKVIEKTPGLTAAGIAAVKHIMGYA